MTEIDLEAIQARVDAATPGPWRAEDHQPNLTRYVLSEDGTLDISFGYVGNRTEPDALFVAAARSDVPALLALVAEQAERMQAVREFAAELIRCGVVGFGREVLSRLDGEPGSGETP